MIRNENLSWVREFFIGLCDNDADKAEVHEIVESLRKLWHVAKAAEQNPYPRSPRLQEALESIKEPGQGNPSLAKSL